MALSFNKRLQKICDEKENWLCIGLDIDPDKFPSGRDTSLKGMETFAKEVIDGTIEFCPVYKPNFAFYERFGSRGYALLERIVDYISGRALVIADAKRGDIGNTSRQYSEAILKTMGCDAITLSPYMGRDTISPFLEDAKKGVFILTMTSNDGAAEIQNNRNDTIPLYQRVVEMASELNENDNIGLVVGATQPKVMEKIRKLSKGLSWLIPGIGAQGGDLQKSVSISNQNGIGVVNISRGILYPENGSMDNFLQENYKNK
ncbi:uncharacterized protein METZ01_LOCUS293004, partial [marine metagenome]